MRASASWRSPAFSKYDVTGPNAEAWLSELLANRMPLFRARMMLSPMLAPTGCKIIGDFMDR